MPTISLIFNRTPKTLYIKNNRCYSVIFQTFQSRSVLQKKGKPSFKSQFLFLSVKKRYEGLLMSKIPTECLCVVLKKILENHAKSSS